MLAPVRDRNMCSITYAGAGSPHIYIKNMEEVLSKLKLFGLKSSTERSLYSCRDFLERLFWLRSEIETCVAPRLQVGSPGRRL